jgi:hypothetical protein
MKAYDYIVNRQILWAQRRGIHLGSQYRNHEDPAERERGRKLFVYTLEDNLFERLTDVARTAFEGGDGGELHADKPGEGNMHALHSSSAAACNLFHYWHARNEVAPIASACGLPSAGVTKLCFEAKYPIVQADRRFPRSPNLDVEIHYEGTRLRVAAIECKFSEPYYGRPHNRLATSYLDLHEKWEPLPNLREIAVAASSGSDGFRHFDVAQVLKHILGLTTAYDKARFRLLYLWYEAPGDESSVLRAEVEAFADAARADGVDFHPLTYQDVMLRLATARAERRPYVDYLVERYL